MKRPRAAVARRTLLSAAAIVLVGTGLGLLANLAHPMRLPMVLGDVEGPGIPRWVWRSVEVADAAEARELWEAGDVVFVDTRNEDDFDLGTIPGSLSLPLHSFSRYYPQALAGHGRSETYLIFCYGSHCGLAMRVAKRLLADGYTHLIVMRGGIAAWEAADYPVEPPSEVAP